MELGREAREAAMAAAKLGKDSTQLFSLVQYLAAKSPSIPLLSVWYCVYNIIPVACAMISFLGKPGFVIMRFVCQLNVLSFYNCNCLIIVVI